MLVGDICTFDILEDGRAERLMMETMFIGAFEGWCR